VIPAYTRLTLTALERIDLRADTARTKGTSRRLRTTQPKLRGDRGQVVGPPAMSNHECCGQRCGVTPSRDPLRVAIQRHEVVVRVQLPEQREKQITTPSNRRGTVGQLVEYYSPLPGDPRAALRRARSPTAPSIRCRHVAASTEHKGSANTACSTDALFAPNTSDPIEFGPSPMGSCYPSDGLHAGTVYSLPTRPLRDGSQELRTLGSLCPPGFWWSDCPAH
jgi:hypothetical protein